MKIVRKRFVEAIVPDNLPNRWLAAVRVEDNSSVPIRAAIAEDLATPTARDDEAAAREIAAYTGLIQETASLM